ncbi:AraC family transcriptional regulator [Alkaliphilus sp. B6464]|uniref:AraC family transcriptional regulator n=1 Tax=Alkaliphilus sp. B6464 TaxID=2731219 RepID=UPI001BA8EFCD|nr:GyrI-like domain-containing protein [Alkaliphilus sp. B6464]QUH20372.1 GyrI-like domain-containing protein [Alkaliphilus sp. B6464]
MNIMIEKMPTYRIAYIRKSGPYGTNNVQTMEELKEWAKFNHLFNDESIILGIAQDNPETTKPENCRYDTCIVVSNDYSVTDGYVREGNIVGGKYAIFKINHTAEAVQKAWIDIFPELSRQGYQFDETRPIIERYIVQMVNNHHCEICVPIY